MRFALLSLLLFGTCFFSPSVSRGEDLYFTTVYSAQRPIINLPHFTHTWATFVKLSRCKPSDQYTVETFTISWLPATLEVKPRKILGEPGVNLSPRKTIEWCCKNDMEIRQFGPFQIDPELYRLEKDRWGVFERGERLYRASDIINSPAEETSCNCTYAVAAPVARQQRFRPVTLGFGYIAGAYIMRRFQPYIYDDTKSHPWVSELIGVENFRQMRLGLLREPAE